jgi:iron complex outermembrane receptor protein
MFNHPRVLPILLLAVFGNPALAEPLSDEDELAQAYGDTSFVSIATGTRQQIRKAPAAATVITADQIASMGARNLSEALVAVPGMHFATAVALHADLRRARHPRLHRRMS